MTIWLWDLPTAWISAQARTNDGHVSHYHTDPACHKFPDEPVPLRDEDRRRAINECSYCSGNLLASSRMRTGAGR